MKFAVGDNIKNLGQTWGRGRIIASEQEHYWISFGGAPPLTYSQEYIERAFEKIPDEFVVGKRYQYIGTEKYFSIYGKVVECVVVRAGYAYLMYGDTFGSLKIWTTSIQSRKHFSETDDNLYEFEKREVVA